MKGIVLCFISLTFLFLLSSIPVQAQSCTSTVCYKDGCGPDGNTQYEYTQRTCTGAPGPLGACAYSLQSGAYRAYRTYTTLNQNTPLGWGCGAGQCGDPAGFGVEDSCSGGNPLEGGECAGGFPRAGGCPAGQYCQGCDMYAGECCNFVPGACQVVLGCSGGSPTPTPTPQPSCTLSCPGTEVSESEFNNATGGAGGGLGQRNTILARAFSQVTLLS